MQSQCSRLRRRARDPVSFRVDIALQDNVYCRVAQRGVRSRRVLSARCASALFLLRCLSHCLPLRWARYRSLGGVPDPCVPVSGPVAVRWYSPGHCAVAPEPHRRVLSLPTPGVVWGFCTTRSPLPVCRRRVAPSCSAIPPSRNLPEGRGAHNADHLAKNDEKGLFGLKWSAFWAIPATWATSARISKQSRAHGLLTHAQAGPVRGSDSPTRAVTRTLTLEYARKPHNTHVNPSTYAWATLPTRISSGLRATCRACVRLQGTASGRDAVVTSTRHTRPPQTEPLRQGRKVNSPATRFVHPHSRSQPTKTPTFPHQHAKKPPLEQRVVSYNSRNDQSTETGAQKGRAPEFPPGLALRSARIRPASRRRCARGTWPAAR